MSQVRVALKKEFGRNKAGLLERIKEHPLLSDEHHALILSYEDRPSKITVDGLIDLYLPYLELNAPNIPNSDSNTTQSPRGKTRGKTKGARGKTRKANVSPNTEEYLRERLQMLHMDDIRVIAKDLHLPIEHFHESQRTRIISLIIVKLVYRHSSVSGHNAVLDANAKKAMRIIDSKYKEIYQSYMNVPTRKSSKANGVKFHNS